MNLDLYIAFVVATAVLILIPGPLVSLVVAHSLAARPHAHSACSTSSRKQR